MTPDLPNLAEIARRHNFPVMQLSRWQKAGTIQLDDPGTGSGSPARIHPAEARAIADTIAEHHRITTARTNLTNGDYYRARLAHHTATEPEPANPPHPLIGTRWRRNRSGTEFTITEVSAQYAHWRTYNAYGYPWRARLRRSPAAGRILTTALRHQPNNPNGYTRIETHA